MTVNEDRPSMGQALAEAYADSKTVAREYTRVVYRAQSGGENRIADATDALTAAMDRVTALLEGHTAHTLEWCHDMYTCPVCTGEVAL